MLAVLAGKPEAHRADCALLAAKSTLNRLELSRPEPTRYHKVSHDPAATETLFVDVFLEAYRRAPKQIILDLDATDDPLHGDQEGGSSMATTRRLQESSLTIGERIGFAALGFATAAFATVDLVHGGAFTAAQALGFTAFGGTIAYAVKNAVGDFREGAPDLKGGMAYAGLLQHDLLGAHRRASARPDPRNDPAL